MRAAGCIHHIEGSVQPARTAVWGVRDLLRQVEVSYLLITLGGAGASGWKERRW
jgi:hypothetical protein